MSTGYYTDPIYLQHDTGEHPERAARLEAIDRHLSYSGLMHSLEVKSARRAEIREIEALHTAEHVRHLEEVSKSGQTMLDTPDCVVSAQTYDAALCAVGAVLDSVVEVAERRLDNAFCAVRPPGHHAERNRAMGFCFFNNVALGAEFLRKNFGYQRILIFDFDVHHGNGTQHLFEESNEVLYASTHQDPRTCYPGTGLADETGLGQGRGYTLNVPLDPGTNDETYLIHFREKVLPQFEEFQPDFVLLSAGFDAHIRDPLASLRLTETAYREITRAMRELAEKHAGGRLVSLLEGGYDLDALASSVEAHIEELRN
jgi:acetoin utilization deacetylase AcuC-like enzyme